MFSKKIYFSFAAANRIPVLLYLISPYHFAIFEAQKKHFSNPFLKETKFPKV